MYMRVHNTGMAILNYIGSLSPVVGGATTAEYVNSMQLMAQSEDICSRMTRMQDTIYAKDKVPKEDLVALWNSNDATTHNRAYGLSVFLSKIEAFHGSCGTASEGRFTASGVSVGECKLFGTLLMLKLIKEDIHIGTIPRHHTVLRTIRGRAQDGGGPGDRCGVPGAVQAVFRCGGRGRGVSRVARSRSSGWHDAPRIHTTPVE